MEKTLSERQAEAALILGDKLNHPRLGATLGLVEELGELVKEVMELEIYRQAEARPKMEDEVADILFSLLEVCNAYGINLETAYDRKLEKIRRKLPEWEEKYSAGLQAMKAKLD
jgi:NTP pyrophosphatase (non-canonical NTP hydrolase)